MASHFSSGSSTNSPPTTPKKSPAVSVSPSGYTGFKIAARDVAPGGTVQVRGRYVEFDVNASTFAVTERSHKQ